MLISKIIMQKHVIQHKNNEIDSISLMCSKGNKALTERCGKVQKGTG